ncbi:hypothetical protein [Acinetobacter towneri]|uniref:hypothetical protein n=1 Tax=Acinetobacter towneri TaxID=202956 RepID=UPI003A84BA4F
MTMFLAPYTAIADIDGSPLDAGFLFFGEYGKDPELFPVEVFWDADFTVPAAQPIRTRNGYPVRNGSPTKVYLKTARHSIAIKNRNSAFILMDFFNKGWDASFVTYNSQTQQKINDGFSSISEMLSITKPKDGMRVFVKSYHAGLNKGGGWFIYDSTKSAINDGVVTFNGWVRILNGQDINPYMTGAKGNWDATAQTGDDDTIAFQKCIDYLNTTYSSFRNAGKRVLSILNGSYRVGSLTIPNANGFGFEWNGEGMMTQLWLDPTSSGITVETEYTKFNNIVFNGKLKATYHSVSDPSIPEIFKFKLQSKALDIDTKFTDCEWHWGSNFARISGRGFNWVDGAIGQSTGSLCVISCDSDLVVAGTDDYHQIETAMRHFGVYNTRVDQLGFLFEIVGTHAVKDYINDIKISGNDFIGLNRVIVGLDAGIVNPSLCDNFATGLSAITNVKNITNLQDTGNNWNKLPKDTIDTAVTAIPVLYNASDSVKGLSITGATKASNISNNIILAGQAALAGQVVGAGNVDGIIINGAAFKHFSSGLALANVINNTGTAKNITITGNQLQSDASTRKRWIANPTNPESIVIDNNITIGSGFDNQRLSYTPTIYVDSTANPAGLTIVKSDASYYIKDNFVYVDFLISLSAQPAAGVLSFTLPNITPVVLESLFSGRIAGFGKVTQSYGVTTELSIEVWTTTNMAVLRVHNADFNLSSVTGNLTISGSFRYKFK